MYLCIWQGGVRWGGEEGLKKKLVISDDYYVESVVHEKMAT